MLLTHQGLSPQIHPTAYIAPTATVCGNVVVGPDSRIMHGAQLIAEGERIGIGEACIIMENAVIRSTARHATALGNFCLVGPHAHLVGCTVEDEVFIATGAAIFHGARVGSGAEVRINGIVHLRSFLPPGAIVPIGWVAVGDPIQILPPDQHEQIWARQEPLNFPLFVYGLDRAELSMEKLTRRLAATLADHRHDTTLDPEG